MWRRCIAHANDPERLFARFRHQVDATYVNRMIAPARGRLNWDNLSSALVLAVRLVLHVGILSDYRKPFWRAARHALRGSCQASVAAASARTSSPATTSAVPSAGLIAAERTRCRPASPGPRS